MNLQPFFYVFNLMGGIMLLNPCNSPDGKKVGSCVDCLLVVWGEPVYIICIDMAAWKSGGELKYVATTNVKT
jgi:Zn-finger protein